MHNLALKSTCKQNNIAGMFGSAVAHLKFSSEGEVLGQFYANQLLQSNQNLVTIIASSMQRTLEYVTMRLKPAVISIIHSKYSHFYQVLLLIFISS